MPEAVIVSALRTPIGTARKGTLRDTDAFTLADHVVAAVADGLDPAATDHDDLRARDLAGDDVHEAAGPDEGEGFVAHAARA
jgi:acetyl-CoA acetyltransferase